MMLENRVMVGWFDKDDAPPALDYQFAGDAVLHPPSGKILLWPGEPLTSKWIEQPKPYQVGRVFGN
ncbi:hypothetical protein [Leisingera sp. M523]|uniref:hypothetical protein n=1 Tax=Leisingera sp. M523 TaxID=2867013 RepID=UPI0021A67E01|nr:hypothetical protein [Leisingera sp. M523]UWQ29622.1 hypothetical protein K3557_03405 [Leisingera sp. M523]